jgi:hypothetical protein
MMKIVGAVLMLSCLLATGCSSYQLQGKVIEGPVAGVLLLSKDDARLDPPGLAGATLDVTLDPGHMGEKRLGAQGTDLEGNFSVPIRELGAGMLEYEVELVGQATGYQATIHKMRLPSTNQRVLVVLREGRNTYRPPRSVIEESLRIGEQSR